MNEAAPNKVWLPLAIFSILALGLYLGMRIEERQHDGSRPTTRKFISKPGKLEEILSYIEARYMDTVDRLQLEEAAIRAMLEKLDPHSIYITAEDMQNIEEQMSGEFEGIGIEFQLLDDTLVVISPLSGSPAEEAGILSGDKIIIINDSLIAGRGLSSTEIVHLLKGSKGTRVSIGLLRYGRDSLLQLNLTRAQIPIHSVDAAYVIEPQIGYIKLNRFSANAYTEFMQALDSLVEKHKVKNLVLDLRDNPGGYLPEAIKLLDQLFTEKDVLLLYTEGAKSPRREYKTNGRAFFPIEKIAVLINEGSASASEIVAGALQDQDRGIIVGRRSFGKGLVQEQYELFDGSALRLTTAHYYTPSGRSIQKPYKSGDDYDLDLLHRHENGELFYADSIKFRDTTHYYTRKGREVHGGGGIVPDVFVPLDSMYFDEDLSSMRSQITPFIIRYIAAAKANHHPLPKNTEELLESELNPKLWSDFLAFAKQNGLSVKPKKIKLLQPQLSRLLKARMAKQLFGENAYFQLLNAEDPDLKAALEAIKAKD